ncbi:hypothetical protein PAHAL_8G192300 [Panicum hallii]|uniref:Neprosin PEP catalytic domain-containing protein n=1 Tax=Panicum hallii TaxID=206008 RepID=A0A2S3IEG4_9POAL|nr:uncharacterized protein LOC112902379 [Panicum hallii]PAN42852.1 hypothetical protein PAHAL_8G192300 [Panicum hallii]
MAATRPCLVALVMALAFLSLLEGAAAAVAGSTRRSAQRRRQVRSLLRRTNKAPLASIQSPDGDVIDCVHISKQPAFDHPFLKNHTILMRPSYHPGDLHGDSNTARRPITQTWHQNGNKCPENTIPIRRTKEEDILRASAVGRYGKKMPRSIQNLVSVNDLAPNATIGHQHAVASAQEDKYYGTNATINLWQPMAERANDFSLAQLWITGGAYNSNDLNTIEAGWQVSQKMYGDNNTRLFIYWTSDGYNKKGCYNLKCPGFIQINNQIAIGGSISPVSIYGGSQYDINIFIRKDPKNGNWWLQVDSYVLGYWPSSIFSYLADSASNITWGGEVYTHDAGQTSTQMGSGHFPEEGLGRAAYIKNIQVIDSSNNIKSPNGVHLIAKQPNCYNVQSSNNSDWGTYIYYGGAGGKNPNCP